MQTSNDTKENLKPSKRVKFSEDTKVFTPLAKPHISAVRKNWIQRSRAGEFEQLKKDLLAYESRELTIEEFFKKEGRALLDWAISSVPNAEPLNFICENVSKELLKEMLSSKDYSMLNTFLLEETGMEESNRVTPSTLENFRKKVKLLLGIDFNGVNKFLKDSLAKNKIGINIKNSIEQVRSELKLDQSFSYQKF